MFFFVRPSSARILLFRVFFLSVPISLACFLLAIQLAFEHAFQVANVELSTKDSCQVRPAGPLRGGGVLGSDGRREAEVERVPQARELALYGADAVEEGVVARHVPLVLLGLLVEREEVLAVAHVREQVVLLRQDKVRVAGHRCAVSHKIGH